VVDGMDLVDDMDAEKTHRLGCVHFVQNVHLVHYLESPIGFNCRI